MKKSLVPLAAVLLGGCTSIEVLAPPVDELFVAEAGVASAQLPHLRAGRQVYMDFCSRCHQPPRVDRIDADDRALHLPRMFAKAELYPQEIALLTAYLEAAAPINPALVEKRRRR